MVVLCLVASCSPSKEISRRIHLQEEFSLLKIMITRRRSQRKMVWSWWLRCCCCGCWFCRASCTRFVEDYSLVCRFEFFVFWFCMWRICIWTICMFLLFEGIAYSSTGFLKRRLCRQLPAALDQDLAGWGRFRPSVPTFRGKIQLRSRQILQCFLICGPALLSYF